MYRRATINDLEEVEKIADNNITKDILLSTFKGNEKYVYVFETDALDILGVMYFGSDDVDNDDFDSEVYGIYAINNELKETIKAEMLFQAKKELYSKGYRNLIIWCNDEDEESKKLYKGVGGIETKKRDNNNEVEVAYSFRLIDYPEE